MNKKKRKRNTFYNDANNKEPEILLPYLVSSNSRRWRCLNSIKRQTLPFSFSFSPSCS